MRNTKPSVTRLALSVKLSALAVQDTEQLFCPSCAAPAPAAIPLRQTVHGGKPKQVHQLVFAHRPALNYGLSVLVSQQSAHPAPQGSAYPAYRRMVRIGSNSTLLISTPYECLRVKVKGSEQLCCHHIGTPLPSLLIKRNLFRV